MGVLDAAATSSPFASLSTELDNRRTQIAQYAIFRAAQYMSTGDKESALKQFKIAVAFDNDNATALKYLGQMYQSQGKTDEAIKYLSKIVSNDMTSSSAHKDLANAYLQDKQYAKAEEEFKTAGGLDPTDPVPDYTLGLLYTQTDRYSEAEAQFKKVGKREPRDANVPYSLGVLYNKLGRTKAAVEQLEKAVTLKGSFAAARYELGAAYMTLGETDKAKDQLTALASLDGGLYSDLEFMVNKPKILTINEDENVSFNTGLGSGTPVWMLDPTQLSTPGGTARVAVAIQFSNDMDVKSVMDPSNWDISRGKGTEAGYYNSMMPVGNNEVSIPSRPYSIVYDAKTRTAKVFFIVCQNNSIDFGSGNRGATIDPSHLVFKFSGKDAAGRQMDTSADQVDGYSIWGF
jgi:tetratricopeptide (TPR) repeat protein